MTPLQAEMLVSTMALVASVVAVEALDTDEDDVRLFQDRVAKEARKAFRAQLSSLKIITPEPRPKSRPPGAQEPGAPSK